MVRNTEDASSSTAEARGGVGRRWWLVVSWWWLVDDGNAASSPQGKQNRFEDVRAKKKGFVMLLIPAVCPLRNRDVKGCLLLHPIMWVASTATLLMVFILCRQQK
eukprot:scaffold22632_cov250-Skeletonema_marinoi.AAC.5